MDDSKKYCPSNGTEGEIFISEFCEHCINEKFIHTQDFKDKQCKLLNNALLYDKNDKEFPEEWTYDNEGYAICTAYVKWDWNKDDDNNDNKVLNNPPPPDDPNQLVLFTFDEQLDELLQPKQIEIEA